MRKKIQNILLLSMLIICNFSFGQNSMEDVVYLKNGSIIRGTIIEQIPNQSVKIQTKDRNVFVFKYDEIEKITKEPLPVENSSFSPKEIEIKKKGFANFTGFNYCVGVGKIQRGNKVFLNRVNSFDIKTINGYRCNEYLYIGVGMGLDNYPDAKLLPVTFHIRATMTPRIVSPVFNTGIGYAIGLTDTNGGIVINPAFGMEIDIFKNIAYTFTIGYKVQAQRNNYTGINYYNTKKNTYFKFVSISHFISF